MFARTHRALRIALTASLLVLESMTASARDAEGARPSLVNPTPADKLRELSTDRPDTTESPFTVDAGHFQLEMSFFDFTDDTRDHQGLERRTVELAPVLVKLGLLDNLDLQLGAVLRTQDRESDASTGARSTPEGFGDLTLRAKINVWGNDGGATAFAVMPFVTFPTADDGLGADVYEYGVIVPFAVELPRELSLGFMLEFDAVGESDGDGYRVEWIHTAVFAFPIAGAFGGFIEYAGFADLDRGEAYRGYFNVGATFGATPNLQFDAGVRVATSRTSDDLGAFVGVAYRY